MSTTKVQLCERLQTKQSTICVLGLGYVGLPLVLRYVEIDFKVLGIDIDADKVRSLNNSQSYIEHISSKFIALARNKGFEAIVDFARSTEADELILCVPTHLNKYREPDLSFVINTLDAVVPYLRIGQVVSLESTSYPGTTEEELTPKIETRNFKVGDDVFLLYSPERRSRKSKFYYLFDS